jgi:hypothetical protein
MPLATLQPPASPRGTGGRGGWIPFRGGVQKPTGGTRDPEAWEPGEQTRGSHEDANTGEWTPWLRPRTLRRLPSTRGEQRNVESRDVVTPNNRALIEYVDYPYAPPQNFAGAMPPVSWTFEPIRRGLRLRHYHYRYESGMGASRFPTDLTGLTRVIAGSHELLPRGSQAPVRMRPGRGSRLTRARQARSYSETTEVLED